MEQQATTKQFNPYEFHRLALNRDLVRTMENSPLLRGFSFYISDKAKAWVEARTAVEEGQ